MTDNIPTALDLDIPKGFILFISGTPGVGKTTTSYELLKRFSCFRIIEETDILRDALRGYNELLNEKCGAFFQSLLGDVEIYDHKKLLTLAEAKQQCAIMKKPLENIILRQQRKGISSIVNGVHIVPETLGSFASNPKVVFVNLYISNEQALYKRLLDRDPESYMLHHTPFIFRNNLDLFFSTEKMAKLNPYTFHNIDVTEQNIEETLRKIIACIHKKVQPV